MTSDLNVLPLSKNSDKDVGPELPVEDLRNQVEVRNKCSLKDDGSVRGVEQLDWVLVSDTSDLVTDKWNVDFPTLISFNNKSLRETEIELAGMTHCVIQ